MTTATQSRLQPFTWIIAAALVVAALPFAVILLGIGHASASAFWWVVLGASVFVVAFPLVVAGLAMRASRRSGDLPRYERPGERGLQSRAA